MMGPESRKYDEMCLRYHWEPLTVAKAFLTFIKGVSDLPDSEE